MAGLMLADRMINLEKSINEREKQIEQKEIDLEKSISAAKAAPIVSQRLLMKFLTFWLRLLSD